MSKYRLVNLFYPIQEVMAYFTLRMFLKAKIFYQINDLKRIVEQHRGRLDLLANDFKVKSRTCNKISFRRK